MRQTTFTQRLFASRALMTEDRGCTGSKCSLMKHFTAKITTEESQCVADGGAMSCMLAATRYPCPAPIRTSWTLSSSRCVAMGHSSTTSDACRRLRTCSRSRRINQNTLWQYCRRVYCLLCRRDAQ